MTSSISKWQNPRKTHWANSCQIICGKFRWNRPIPLGCGDDTHIHTHTDTQTETQTDTLTQTSWVHPNIFSQNLTEYKKITHMLFAFIHIIHNCSPFQPLMHTLSLIVIYSYTFSNRSKQQYSGYRQKFYFGLLLVWPWPSLWWPLTLSTCNSGRCQLFLGSDPIDGSRDLYICNH